jgi:hypothetical protein
MKQDIAPTCQLCIWHSTSPYEEGKLGKGAKAETTWEKHLREQKDKKEKKKGEKKAGAGGKTAAAKGAADADDADDSAAAATAAEEDGDGGDGGTGFDDSFFMDGGDDDDLLDGNGGDDISDDEIGEKRGGGGREVDAFALTKAESKKSKKRSKRQAADDPETLKGKADLELLMMDDQAVRGRDIRGVGARARVDAEEASAAGGEDRLLVKRKTRKERLAEKKKVKKGKAARRQGMGQQDTRASTPVYAWWPKSDCVAKIVLTAYHILYPVL